MDNKNQPEGMEKHLAEQFTSSNLSKVQLSSVSKYIAALQKTGINIHDVFPQGLPQIRQWVVEGQLSIDKAAALPELLANKVFKEIHLFRKGVPVPVFFNVQAIIEEK